MLHGRWSGPVLGRVNPIVPVAVAAVGLIVALAGPRAVGLGVMIGAALALVNSVLLSRRIDVAADMANVGHALLVMQVGLLINATVIGVVTIVLLHFSLGLAVAAAAGFAVAQLGTLAAFYWTRGREQRALEGEVT